MKDSPQPGNINAIGETRIRYRRSEPVQSPVEDGDCKAPGTTSVTRHR